MNMAQYENTPDRFAAPYPSARMSEQVSGFVTAVYINELDEAFPPPTRKLPLETI
jgi:hypothetical protein